MALDYNDIICQAIDTIVSKRIEGLEYDKTITATIVDDSDAMNGHYIVNDGSINFDAYSEETGYVKDDNVYVTVPRGDFTQTKIIISKYTKNNDTDPIAFQSPLDSMYIISDNLAAGGVLINNSILANGRQTWTNNITPPGRYRLVWEKDLTKDPDYVVQNNAVFDRLAVSAEFMCTLGSTYNVVQGNYGLIVELQSVLNNDTANVGQSTRFYLDSDEMFGNAYTFSSFITQSKRFDISNLNTITHINIYLYQGDNFYHRARGSAENQRVPTPWETDSNGIGLDIDDSRNNIFVNNLSVYLGIDTTNIDDNTFKIYSSSPSTYDMIEAQANPEYNQKVIIPVWFNKDENTGRFIGYSDGIWDYKPDGSSDTELAGLNYNEDKYIDLSGYYNRAATLPQDELVHDKNIPNVLGLLQSYADGLDIQSMLDTMSLYLDTKLPGCIVDCIQALRLYQTGEQQLASGTCREFAIGEKDPNAEPPRNNQSYLDFIALLNTVRSDENVNGSFMHQLLVYLQNFGTWYSSQQNAITAANVNTYITNLKAIVAGSGNSSFEQKYTYMKNAILRFFGEYSPASNYNIYKYTPNGLKAVVDGWKDSVLQILADCDELREKIMYLIANTEDVNSAERKLTIEWNLQQVQQHFANGNFADYEEERQAFLRQWANKYCIYWYRYAGENASVDDAQLKDNFMPSGWERIDNLTNNGLPKGFTINEQDGNYYFDARPADGRVLMTVGDDKLTQEKIQAVLIYNHELFKSNVLTFYNDRPVIDDMAADMTTGLYLQLSNEEKNDYGTVTKKDTYNSKETYQLYGITNRIINSSERIKRRTIRARFRGLTKTDEYLKKNCIIYWYFPINSTMLEYKRDELVAAGFSVYDPQYLRTQTDADMNDFNKWVKEKGLNISTQALYDQAYGMYTSTVLGLPYPPPGEPFIQHYRPGYAMIWRNIESMTENGVEVLNAVTTEFFYYIKEWYVPSFTNNTIYCKVVKSNKYSYEAEQYFTFTSYGTSGTDYSLCITPAGRQCAVRDDTPLHLKVEVYDTNGQIMPEETAKVNISWYKNFGSPAAALIYTGRAPDIYVQKLPNTTYIYGVLQAQTTITLSYEEDTITSSSSHTTPTNDLLNTNGSRKTRNVNLIAYYPIAWAADDYYIEGATTVVYDSLGSSPAYYEGYYKLFHGRDSTTYSSYADQTIKNGYLKVNSAYSEYYNVEYKSDTGANATITTLVKEASPKLKKMTGTTDDLNNLYQLSMPSMYLENDRYCTVQLGVRRGTNTPVVLYKQPILVIKNRYSSPMLNNWDGELTIDKKNGTILSTMMGAGIKETDNTFSGVLMGDVAQTSGATSDRGTQGLYGFHHGEQSFGFKNNGTAFIGKAGKGRIEFDGNHGEITSSSYKSGSTGMRIDLDDGIIDMRGSTIATNANKQFDDNDQNNNEINGYSNSRTYSKVNSSQVLLQVISPFFKIVSPSTNKTELIHIGTDAYYLQTDDYKEGTNSTKTNGTGLKFNLQQGTLDAYNFALKAADPATGTYLKLTSLGTPQNPFFQIHYQNALNSPSTSIDLIHVSKTSFFLQSPNWNDANHTGTQFYLYSADHPTWNGVLTSYTGKIQYGDAIFSSTAFAKNTGTKDGWPASNEAVWRLFINTDFGVTNDGKIYSSAGRIGGWEILADRLRRRVSIDNKAYEIGMFAPNNPTAANEAFYVGYYANSNYTGGWTNDFAAFYDGRIVARKGTFSGSVTAASISGSYISGSTIEGNTISGGTITGGSISGGSITGAAIYAGPTSNSQYAVSITDSGVSITGTITATQGKIGPYTINSDNLAGNNVTLSDSEIDVGGGLKLSVNGYNNTRGTISHTGFLWIRASSGMSLYAGPGQYVQIYALEAGTIRGQDEQSGGAVNFVVRPILNSDASDYFMTTKDVANYYAVKGHTHSGLVSSLLAVYSKAIDGNIVVSTQKPNTSSTPLGYLVTGTT